MKKWKKNCQTHDLTNGSPKLCDLFAAFLSKAEQVECKC